MVGNSEEYRNLDSLKMGCVRLSNLFFDKDSGTISAKRYAALQNYIRNNALRSFQRIADFVIEEAVASSGTAQNLAEIAAALDAEDAARTGRAPQESRDVLSYGGLRRAVKELCGRTLKERRKARHMAGVAFLEAAAPCQMQHALLAYGMEAAVGMGHAGGQVIHQDAVLQVAVADGHALESLLLHDGLEDGRARDDHVGPVGIDARNRLAS